MKKHNDHEREDQISLLFNSYQVPEINGTDKKETIELLKAYMPIHQEPTIELMKKLVWQAFIEILSRYKFQLLILLLLMFMTYTVIPENMDRWIIFILIAPSPLFLVGWHVMNLNSESMVELEMTYKYSFQQMIFSKIVAISVCSIFIYTVAFLYMILINDYLIATTLFHIAVTGLTPILLFCLALLTLSIKYRNLMSWTVILLAWILFALLSVYTPMGTIFFMMNTSIYITVNIFLIVLIVYRLKKVWRMERIQDEFN